MKIELETCNDEISSGMRSVPSRGQSTVYDSIGAHGPMSHPSAHHCTRKSLTIEFSWARLQWLGFKRSYLIGVGKVSCKKCGRVFSIEEGNVQKALAKRAAEFKGDLQEIALDQID